MSVVPEGSFFNIKLWHVAAVTVLFTAGLGLSIRDFLFLHVDPTRDVIMNVFNGCILTFFFCKYYA